MRKQSFLLLTPLLLSLMPCCCGTEPISKEKALARIESCLHWWDSSNRACADLNANIDVLINAYKNNDKSALRELLKFPYLTNFFDDALLSDPSGFLSAVKVLPEDRQNAISAGLAGEQFRTLPKARFVTIKAVLEAVPSDSPNRAIADTCLKALNEHNASLFVDYFPPGTFTGRDAGFITDWYSGVLYGFNETPLWRSSPKDEATWRFTYIGAWGGSRIVTLTMGNNGVGTIRAKWRDQAELGKPAEPGKLRMTDSIAVSADKLDRFLEALRQAQFWELPAQAPTSGFDGAEWLLEGAQDGHYHVVVRWCPGFESKDAQTLSFSQACRLLLEYAGHDIGPTC